MSGRSRRLTIAWTAVFGLALAAAASAQFNIPISGTVFHDLDADGTFDAGEPGVPGVVVTVDFEPDGPDGEPDDQTTTGPLGTYLQLAPPGTYRFRVVLPEGFVQTTPDPPDVVAEPGSAYVVNFGIVGGRAIPTLDGWAAIVFVAGLSGIGWLAARRGGTAAGA